MTPTEKQMIDDLFSRLQQAGHQAAEAGQKPEAEALAHIEERLRSTPQAPYYMAQALVVQDEALKGLSARVEDLERQLAEASRAPAQAQTGGGFLSSLFGGPSRSAPRSPSGRSSAAQLREGARPTQAASNGAAYGTRANGPWGGAGMSAQAVPGQAFAQAPRGGFLAGAMQTAVGVAGGVLLGNAVASMFSEGAHAAEASPMMDDGAVSGVDSQAMDDGSVYDDGLMGGQDDGGGLFDDFGGDFGGDDQFF